jgi:hypothetical protein
VTLERLPLPQDEEPGRARRCSATRDGERVIEHVAGIEDAQLALAPYQAVCKRWPGAAITLRQGAKVFPGADAVRAVRA